MEDLNGFDSHQMVETIEGPLPFCDLEVKEHKSEGNNELAIAREWYYQGRLVRRDAWVTQLRGHSTEARQKEF